MSNIKLHQFFGLQKILISLLIISFSASAALASQTFRLKSKAAIGSRIPTVDAESAIPFDKSYGQLTAEQQAIFRASYGGLADTEKPPFPLKGTQAIYKPIIKGHKAIAKTGTLYLIAMIDETGKVENVSVYESPAEEMSKLASAVVFDTEFEPASCAGNPCKMEFPFEFELRPVAEDLDGTSTLQQNSN